MPKDQWAATRRRNAVRKAQAKQDHAEKQAEFADCWLGRSIAHERGLDVRKMTRKEITALGAQSLLNVKRDKPAKITARTPCPNCGSTEKSVHSRAFKDGSYHSQVNCGKCRKFLKWGEV